MHQAQSRGWCVLLDAAAFTPTNRLDLSTVKPDFVSLSFYKMFGYPTGVGALLMRRSSAALLKRPWFSGGTVKFASMQAQAHVLVSGEGAFEDGTVNYLSIPAVGFGLRHLQSVGVEQIQLRTSSLTSWLIRSLLKIRHSNGRHMVRIYGPITSELPGPTVTMNLYDPAGCLLDYRRLEELANKQGISVRTGCFCNPGAGEIAEGLTEADMVEAVSFGDEISPPRFLQTMRERGNGKGAPVPCECRLGLRATFGMPGGSEVP